jgi:hypothetical protein
VVPPGAMPKRTKHAARPATATAPRMWRISGSSGWWYPSPDVHANK